MKNSEILHRARKSKWIFLFDFVIFIASVAVAYFLFEESNEIVIKGLTIYIGSKTGIIIAIVCAYVVYEILTYSVYSITQSKIYLVYFGTLTQTEFKVNINDIDRVVMKQGKLSSFFNLGSVWFYYIDDKKPKIKFKLIDRPVKVVKLVNELKQKQS